MADAPPLSLNGRHPNNPNLGSGVPSPASYLGVLSVVCRTDPRNSTAASSFETYVSCLSDDQASEFEAALGGVLRLLTGDMDRLRFVASAIVEFDLIGTAASLVEVALQARDRDLMLSAAFICGNPAVGAGLRSRMRQALSGDRLALMRLDPGLVPVTAYEKLLYDQCWPGQRRSEAAPRLPAVVVLDRTLGARTVLSAALGVVVGGGTVRQMDPQASAADWFGPATVLVCTEATLEAVAPNLNGLHPSRVLIDPVRSASGGVHALASEVNALLPPGLKLRFVGSDS